MPDRTGEDQTDNGEESTPTKKRLKETRANWVKEREIKANPMGANPQDVAWLAQRLEQRLQKPVHEGYQADPEMREWMRESNFSISQDNDRAFLEFLMKVLPTNAALDAAEIQAKTSRRLVRWTMALAIATIILAAATIVLVSQTLPPWDWPLDWPWE